MLKNKLPKIHPEQVHQYRQQVLQYSEQLSDIRVVGLLIFLGITLLITWSGVKAIDTNYGLQKQVATLQQQNTNQKLTNSNLALQNDYYNTNQYLEVAARQSFGLGEPGETELLVPTSVAMADTTTLTNPEQQLAAKAVSKQPVYQRNFESWMDFLLHRQTT
jgi:cell division protein FtsB